MTDAIEMRRLTADVEAHPVQTALALLHYVHEAESVPPALLGYHDRASISRHAPHADWDSKLPRLHKPANQGSWARSEVCQSQCDLPPTAAKCPANFGLEIEKLVGAQHRGLYHAADVMAGRTDSVTTARTYLLYSALHTPIGRCDVDRVCWQMAAST